VPPDGFNSYHESPARPRVALVDYSLFMPCQRRCKRLYADVCVVAQL